MKTNNKNKLCSNITMFDQFNVDVIKYSFLYFYSSCLPIDLGEFRGFFYTPALWIGAYDRQFPVVNHVMQKR